MEYTFTLNYQLPEHERSPLELVEQLGAANCTDATIGIGRSGRMALKFTRTSTSAMHAIMSALDDVRSAVPYAKLIEASPDLVGLTEAADSVGMSRQNLRKLMLTHTANFPAPLHTGSSALWHLADVLHWLQKKGGYNVSPLILETAEAALQINAAKHSLRLLASTPAALQDLLAEEV